MNRGIVLLKYNQDSFEVKLKKMVSTYFFGHNIINLHTIMVSWMKQKYPSTS